MADRVPLTVAGEVPAWVGRLPLALLRAIGSGLIPGYAWRWL
jgi:hypothetical protein